MMKAIGLWSMVLLLAHCGDGNSGESASETELKALVLSTGILSPSFAPSVTSYSVTVGYLSTSITVTATTADAGAMLTVNGSSATSGQAVTVALTEGSNVIQIVVTGPSGTTRTYTLSTTRQNSGAFAQQAYIKSSNAGTSDQFGYAVALSGDTLAVGAFNEDSNGTGQNNESASNSGAVYVFARSGATWTQQAYLKASNVEAGDVFGQTLALSGDTLAVGAVGEDSNGIQTDNSQAQSGAVYVFVRSGSVWSQQAYLKASNAQADDYFGTSVALLGDTLAVGAAGEDSNGTGPNDESASNSGAAYVFVRSGTTWTQQAYVKASNAETGDRFGDSIALSGETLVVGADREDGNSGAAYVFVRSGTAWSQQAYVKASNAEAGDYFGWSVALSGDTLAVGAIGEDSNAVGVGQNQANNSASGSGAVYVFTRSGTSWTQQAYVKASNTEAGDSFGWGVAVSGDTLAVAAILESSDANGIGGTQADNSASGSGAVYVFVRSGSIWTQHFYVKASNSATGDSFGGEGVGVALSGDTLAVGADLESGIAGAAGASYVFR